MIKKILSPYVGIIEQITTSVFDNAHTVLRTIEDKIAGWSDNLWAGEEE